MFTTSTTTTTTTTIPTTRAHKTRTLGQQMYCYAGWARVFLMSATIVVLLSSDTRAEKSVNVICSRFNG